MGFFKDVERKVKKVAPAVFPVHALSNIPTYVGYEAATGKKPFSFLDDLFGGPVTQEQEALETPEQRLARQLLLKYATTGQLGDIQAGQPLGLPYAGYEPTDIEQMGLERLRGIVGSGEPGELGMARSALQDLLATSEGAIDKQFQPFRERTEREIREAERNLKRQSAYTGRLYGTSTIRDLGEIESRGQEVLAQKMADLYSEALNRKLQAIPLATDLARTTENIEMGRVGASQTYGSLNRLLAAAEAEAKRNEILRRRGEQESRINALTAVGGQAPQFGVKEATTYVPSAFENLLNMIVGVGGQAVGGWATGRGMRPATAVA